MFSRSGLKEIGRFAAWCGCAAASIFRRNNIVVKSALILSLFGSSQALLAQATAPDNINGTYPVGSTNLGGSAVNTQNPATITGLGDNQGITFSVSGTVNNDPSGLNAHWERGLNFLDEDTLELQFDDIIFANNDFATVVLDFSAPVYGLNFRWDRVDFADGGVVFAFDENGDPIPLTLANVAGLGSILTASVSGNGLFVRNETNNSNTPERFFDFTVPITQGISRIEIRQIAKVATNAGTHTTTLGNFSWAAGSPAPTPISATNDNATVNDGISGALDVLNVLDNDTLNNAAINPADVTLAVNSGSSLPSQLAFNSATGQVDVLAGTFAGTYSFDYDLCEAADPGNCATATATITVPAAPELEITKTADDDQFVTAGQLVTYTYTVTNSGNEFVRDVTINDVHNGSGPAPSVAGETLLADNNAIGDSTDVTTDDGIWSVLAPGDVVTFIGTYTVQQADIDNLQ